MSSSMLEQAVIDAHELKEAAVKNAEHAVLEKYSNEIKEAVNSLLEEEDEFLDFEDSEMESVDPEAGSMDPITEKIPLAATSDESEIITLDLNELGVAFNQKKQEKETKIDLNIKNEMMFEGTEEDVLNLINQEEKENELTEENDEEITLDEDSLKNAIEEILKVDIENVARGDLGSNHPTKPQEEYAENVELSAEQDTELSEKNKELRKTIKKLEEQINSLNLEKNKVVKDYKNLKSIARKVSDKLTDLNVTNGKLVYQNRVLESSSLNERQKSKLVEAISKSNSIEESKVIFETLQGSLLSNGNNSPKTLSEAVNRNNHLVLKSNKKEAQGSNSAIERMKKLAGII